MRSAVIVDVVRTASGKGKEGGALSGIHPATLLAEVLQALMERNSLDPAVVDDVIAGCVTQSGEQALNVARTAVLAAGFPESVPATTIDRQCGSSQQAVHFAAQAVMAGVQDVVIACGVESMSRVPMFSNAQGADTNVGPLGHRYPDPLGTQGIAAELVSSQWNLSRSELDEFAARSHARAAETAAENGFKNEIIPIGGHTEDETVRAGTAVEKLAGLAPAFVPDGLITPGNSSPLTDGASAALIMSEEHAISIGLRPRARFHSFSVVGSDPRTMLTGVIPATSKALVSGRLSINDIDAFEVNEAFAPVPLAWRQWFAADPKLVNPRGGAIALGHPPPGNAPEPPRADRGTLRTPDNVRRRRHGQRHDHRAALNVISFQHDEHVLEAIARTQQLVRDVVLPVESKYDGNAHELSDDVRRELQRAARDAGVFAPHVSEEYGGLGLGMADRAPVFEAAGYSLFGPLALNCAAPDEGNAHLLEVVATPEQKERFLRPLATGETRSCFAMTEPAPGAGSDPTALATTARRTTEGWVINGHKWFITGANGAGFAVVMARTSGDPGDRGGATMFLVDTATPGFTRVRDVDTLDQSMIGGHSELVFTDLEVGLDAVLGEVDKGFEYAQVRLGPARMTHCMRWLGTARRAADIALLRANERQLFGGRLGELGLTQGLLADNEIDIEASRALILKACSDLDAGAPSAQITSVTKTFVAEAVNRVVDRSLQVCGSLGVSGDAPLSRIYREVRPFRIYDGPSETHRWAIAKRALSGARA